MSGTPGSLCPPESVALSRKLPETGESWHSQGCKHPAPLLGQGLNPELPGPARPSAVEPESRGLHVPSA